MTVEHKQVTLAEVQEEAEKLGLGTTVAEWSAFLRREGWGLGVWLGEWDEGFIAGEVDGQIWAAVYSPDPRNGYDRWESSWEDGTTVESESLEISLGLALVREVTKYRARLAEHEEDCANPGE